MNRVPPHRNSFSFSVLKQIQLNLILLLLLTGFCHGQTHIWGLMFLIFKNGKTGSSWLFLRVNEVMCIKYLNQYLTHYKCWLDMWLLQMFLSGCFHWEMEIVSLKISNQKKIKSMLMILFKRETHFQTVKRII